MTEEQKNVATNAWSMWAFYVLIVLEAVPYVLSALPIDLQPTPQAMSAITIVAVAAGALARLQPQSNVGGLL